MVEAAELYHLKPEAIAEGDGSCWSWKGLCPSCGRSGRIQTGDAVATLVSHPAPIVATDGGLLLLDADLQRAALAAGLAFPSRPAKLFDRELHLEAFVQVTADFTLQTRSSRRNPCGCITTQLRRYQLRDANRLVAFAAGETSANVWMFCVEH